MVKAVMVAVVLAVLGQGCERSPGPLPEIRKATPPAPLRIPKPDFTVLEQEVSGIEATFVVMTPDAPKTPQETLLWVADYLAQDREPIVKTLVLFRDPRYPPPTKKRSLMGEFAISFAFAEIHPIAKIREARIGVFN